MASPIASTSRTIVRQSFKIQSRNGRQFSSRLFSTSSPIAQREVVIRMANINAVVQLPSLPAWLSRLLPSVVHDECSIPALANIPNEPYASSTSTSESNQDGIEWDGILHAVPKSKISHSRKAMRHANKGLKDRVDFVHCPACGKPKLAHHICAHCYSFISRSQKQETRLAQNQTVKQGQGQQD